MPAALTTAVLEHARKLDDAREPQGRASMLAGLVALTSGAPEPHLDSLARVLIREQPEFLTAVTRTQPDLDTAREGIGLVLIVRSATHPEIAVRLRLCNVYAEAFKLARCLRNSPTLGGIGYVAARRLAERVDGNVSGVLRVVAGTPHEPADRPAGSALPAPH